MKPPGTATPSASARERGRGVGDTVRSGGDAPATGDDALSIARTPSPAPAARLGEGSHEPHPFGQHLEPILRAACDGRLSPVQWFRTDWQRGGALTGYATLQDDAAGGQEVVVKLPIPPRERDWLRRLQGEDPTGPGGRTAVTHPGYAAPRLFAHGDSLNGYDLAWVVMERLPHGPLGAAWNGHEFDLLVDAAGRFYERTAAVPVEPAGPHRDWEDLLRRSRDTVRQRGLPEAQAWKHALKHATRKLDGWMNAWNSRPMNDWCHGDLHLGNAMSRLAARDHRPGSAEHEAHAVLLDLAEVRPGHWIEDAVYCEHLYWSRRERLGGRKLCSMIARQRRRRGLHAGDWAELAKIKRCLLALATPCRLDVYGDPRHLAAALAVLHADGG